MHRRSDVVAVASHGHRCRADLHVGVIRYRVIVGADLDIPDLHACHRRRLRLAGVRDRRLLELHLRAFERCRRDAPLVDLAHSRVVRPGKVVDIGKHCHRLVGTDGGGRRGALERVERTGLDGGLGASVVGKRNRRHGRFHLRLGDGPAEGLVLNRAISPLEVGVIAQCRQSRVQACGYSLILPAERVARAWLDAGLGAAVVNKARRNCWNVHLGPRNGEGAAHRTNEIGIGVRSRCYRRLSRIPVIRVGKLIGIAGHLRTAREGHDDLARILCTGFNVLTGVCPTSPDRKDSASKRYLRNAHRARRHLLPSLGVDIRFAR